MWRIVFVGWAVLGLLLGTTLISTLAILLISGGLGRTITSMVVSFLFGWFYSGSVFRLYEILDDEKRN